MNNFKSKHEIGKQWTPIKYRDPFSNQYNNTRWNFKWKHVLIFKYIMIGGTLILIISLIFPVSSSFENRRHRENSARVQERYNLLVSRVSLCAKVDRIRTHLSMFGWLSLFISWTSFNMFGLFAGSWFIFRTITWLVTLWVTWKIRMHRCSL